MTRPSFVSMVDEFCKIAGISAEEGKLQPGDVILTGKGSELAWEGRFMGKARQKMLEKGLLKPLLGDYVHAGIYVGDGKVIDANPNYGVGKVPLSTFDRTGVKVLRPNLPEKDRQDAIRHAHTMVGAAYSQPAAIKAWAKSTFGHLKPHEQVHNTGVICSNLVAEAYKGKLTPWKDVSIALPGDFARSRRVSEVTTVKDPEA